MPVRRGTRILPAPAARCRRLPIHRIRCPARCPGDSQERRVAVQQPVRLARSSAALSAPPPALLPAPPMRLPAPPMRLRASLLRQCAAPDLPIITVIAIRPAKRKGSVKELGLALAPPIPWPSSPLGQGARAAAGGPAPLGGARQTACWLSR